MDPRVCAMFCVLYAAYVPHMPEEKSKLKKMETPRGCALLCVVCAVCVPHMPKQ